MHTYVWLYYGARVQSGGWTRVHKSVGLPRGEEKGRGGGKRSGEKE